MARRHVLHLAIGGLLGTAAACSTSNGDPYLWLEEVESEAALQWARSRNEKAVNLLTRDPRHAEIEAGIRKILLAPDRVPLPDLQGGWIYNFWQDARHVRGIWRRTRPEEYEKENPAWETVLDLDDLARRENENW